MPPGRPPRLLALLAAAALAACAHGSGELADRTGRLAPPGGTPVEASAFGQYLIGRFAGAEQDSTAAAEALLQALRADPDQPELIQRAFLAAVMDGRADALRLARRLPDSLPAQLVLFGADLAGGRFDRAEPRARALARHGGLQAIQPALHAWTLHGRGQTDAALNLLRQPAEQGRFRAINALHAALIADLAGRPREAERYARLALADQPDPALRLALLSAGVLHRAGRTPEAERLLDRLATSPDELALAAAGPARAAVLGGRLIAGPVDGVAEAYVALGAALRGQGLEEFSALLARLALRIRPGFAPALLLLADVLAEAEQHAAALEVLGQIAAEDPLHGPAQLRRAGLLDRLDRLPEAERVLAEAAARHTDQPQPLVRLGDIQRRRGRFAEAARAYDAALQRVPAPGAEDWTLFYVRGIARERAGNWQGAEADFLRALELSPEQPYVLNYLGYTWADQGVNLERARQMLERAVALRPEDGNIVDSLGWALFRLGDIPGAVRWLERAVELEPRNATINDHLGDAYWAAGRLNEARFQWRRALGMDPDPAEAARIEGKLRNGLPGRPAAQRR